MKFIISAAILALTQKSVSSKEPEFEIFYDYYESSNPADIFKSNKLDLGGKSRALQDSNCACDLDSSYEEEPWVCFDDLSVLDSEDGDCSFYTNYPDFCGYWDDDDFTASDACCACGGVGGGPCDDLSVTDSDGYDCLWYADFPGYCGQYDTSDFVASQACCACGDRGGSVDSERYFNWYSDTDVFQTCQDDTTNTDSEGDNCSWYVDDPSDCGNNDDADFTAADDCCACGGGSVRVDPGAGTPDENGCTNDMSVTDKYGETCSYYDSDPLECGYYDDQDFNSTAACCACANAKGDSYTEDRENGCVDDFSVTDNFGNGCYFYDYHQDYCGVYDNTNFISNVACCACAAGYGPQSTDTTCTDFTGALDEYDDDCTWYMNDAYISMNYVSGECGLYDDDDFTAATQCCACGGGDVVSSTDTCVDDISISDAGGFTCYAYTLFPSDCGKYDDDDFTSTQACCACQDNDREDPTGSVGQNNSCICEDEDPGFFSFITDFLQWFFNIFG